MEEGCDGVGLGGGVMADADVTYTVYSLDIRPGLQEKLKTSILAVICRPMQRGLPLSLTSAYMHMVWVQRVVVVGQRAVCMRVLSYTITTTSWGRINMFIRKTGFISSFKLCYEHV